MKNKQLTKKPVSIGGQAVMEGVMMRGRTAMATAVRDPEGDIQIESERLIPPEKRSKFSRLPFVRGVLNFVSSLTDGNRVLMRSAEVLEEDPKDGETEITPDKKNDGGFLNGLATVIGVVLLLLERFPKEQFLPIVCLVAMIAVICLVADYKNTRPVHMNRSFRSSPPNLNLCLLYRSTCCLSTEKSNRPCLLLFSQIYYIRLSPCLYPSVFYVKYIFNP